MRRDIIIVRSVCKDRTRACLRVSCFWNAVVGALGDPLMRSSAADEDVLARTRSAGAGVSLAPAAAEPVDGPACSKMEAVAC